MSSLLRESVNSLFEGHDAFSILSGTLLTILVIYVVRNATHAVSKHGIAGAVQLFVIRTMQTVPGGSSIIEAEKQKSSDQMRAGLPKLISKHEAFRTLPELPVSRTRIREELLFQLSQEQAIITKRGHGGIYVKINAKYDKYLGKPSKQANKQTKIIGLIDKHFTIKEEAYLYFSHTNNLYPFVFPGTRKFDIELISMAASMLHAPEVAGNIASGGTESIFLAMKCWRSYAEKVRGIGGACASVQGNIVMCHTAHTAFPKACEYLRLEARYVDFYNDKADSRYGQINLEQLDAAIDSNTVCVIASAPCFPFSVVDDIESVCQIAKKHGDIPVHVDNCLGGFLLSFLYDKKLIDRCFDFRVDGVRSISCDMHKQAGSDKGVSVILYSSKEYRKYQYYAFVNWPGGLYCSATFQGAANGGLKAVAWAMLLSKGKKKLSDDGVALFEKVKQFRDKLDEQIEDCDVLGQPLACGVAFKFKGKVADCDYGIAEALSEVGGWQLVRLQFPTALFFQASQNWIDEVDQLVEDIKKAVELVKQDPKKYNSSGMAGIYGAAATFPDRSMIEDTCATYLDVIHSPAE